MQFVAAPPDDVFALITTPERLPEWNGAIVRVVDAPDQLSPGAEWVVQLSALGQSWPSRSTVVAHRSGSATLCVPFADRRRQPLLRRLVVAGCRCSRGCEVTVSCALHPATFWRRVLLAKIRSWQLRRRELPASLHALASFATTVHDA